MLYCGIALFIACFFIFGEPFTNGHFLSTWLRYGAENSRGVYDDSIFAPEVEEVEPALQRIGSKAIPTLLKRVDATDPPWKRSLNHWQDRTDWLPQVMKIRFRGVEEEHAQAIYGFGALNTQAVSAIPALAQRLNETNTATTAAYCLAKIGSPSLPILRMALTNEQASVRMAAIYGLQSDPSLLKQTLSEMRLLRADSDVRNALVAFHLLYHHSPSNEAVVLLREALRDPRTLLVIIGLSKIESLGTHARPFIPELSNLLAHPYLRFREQATNVLKTIDPAVAFAAGVNTNPPVLNTNRSGGPGGRYPRIR
jgi:hypothetical protein